MDLMETYVCLAQCFFAIFTSVQFLLDTVDFLRRQVAPVSDLASALTSMIQLDCCTIDDFGHVAHSLISLLLSANPEHLFWIKAVAAVQLVALAAGSLTISHRSTGVDVRHGKQWTRLGGLVAVVVMLSFSQRPPTEDTSLYSSAKCSEAPLYIGPS